MGQTNNTRLYQVDTNPELSDLLFGSNSKNFLISSVLDLINAQNLIQFEFSDGVNTEITRYTTGKFLTNNNTLDPLTFTKFYFNKSNVKPLNLSPLFEKLALTSNVVLRLEKQDNSNSFFEFKIVSIENHTDYFTINVIPSFYLGLLENNKKYNVTFSIKAAASGGDSGIAKISGENINSHTPIAIINNLAYKLDASNPLHQFAFAGFTEASSIIGNPCTIKQIGEVTLSGWGLTPNQQYLSGINGTLITSNVSVSNFTKVIGYATTSNTLQIIKDSITINK